MRTRGLGRGLLRDFRFGLGVYYMGSGIGFESARARGILLGVCFHGIWVKVSSFRVWDVYGIQA